MISSTKIKACAGISGVAALLALSAAPAFAVDTGNEALNTPITVPAGSLVGTVPYAIPVDGNGNPIDADLGIKGSGYSEGSSVYAMVCDGKLPTAPGWNPNVDCDNLTATAGFPAGAAGAGPGNIFLDPTQNGYTVGVFRGESPGDLFNCLAPGDDPNGTQVSVPNAQDSSAVAPIDSTVPSWGSSKALSSAGGGSTPCLVRVSYTPTVFDSSSDKFIPLSLTNPPGTVVPESPLTIALPIGGVVLFGAAGAVLYRKRRSTSVAA